MNLRSIEVWWELDGEDISPRGFFRSVESALPTATTVYVEGCAIDPAVVDVYDRHREKGRYLPGRDTIYPRSTIRRCTFSPELVAALEALAETHEVPSLFDHITIYSESTPLLYWHDAFDNVLRISGGVAEGNVQKLAESLGVPYRTAG